MKEKYIIVEIHNGEIYLFNLKEIEKICIANKVTNGVIEKFEIDTVLIDKEHIK